MLGDFFVLFKKSARFLVFVIFLYYICDINNTTIKNNTMKITAKFHLEASILGEVEIAVIADCEHGQEAARNQYGYPTEMAIMPKIDIIQITVDSTEMDSSDAAKMFSLTETEFLERCEEEAWDEFSDWN